MFILAWVGVALCIHHRLAYMGVTWTCKEREEFYRASEVWSSDGLAKRAFWRFLAYYTCDWEPFIGRADLAWSAMDMLHTPETWHRCGGCVFVSYYIWCNLFDLLLLHTCSISMWIL